MLHVLNQMREIEVLGLVTTFNQEFDRVAMHGVRRNLVEAQAEAVGLPLFKIYLPWPCSNEIYESIMMKELAKLKDIHQPSHIAFGDLFLEDIREYRIKQMASTGYELLFPLWQLDTGKLAREMVNAGVRAILCCIDPNQLSECFAGRVFNDNLLGEFPESVDPCGENGEFHSFAYAGPMFRSSISVSAEESVERDGFVYTDIQLTE